MSHTQKTFPLDPEFGAALVRLSEQQSGRANFTNLKLTKDGRHTPALRVVFKGDWTLSDDGVSHTSYMRGRFEHQLGEGGTWYYETPESVKKMVPANRPSILRKCSNGLRALYDGLVRLD